MCEAGIPYTTCSPYMLTKANSCNKWLFSLPHLSHCVRRVFLPLHRPLLPLENLPENPCCDLKPPVCWPAAPAPAMPYVSYSRFFVSSLNTCRHSMLGITNVDFYVPNSVQGITNRHFTTTQHRIPGITNRHFTTSKRSVPWIIDILFL